MTSQEYYDEIKQRSAQNLETHKMTILQDSDSVRRVHFQREDGRFVYSFDLITWPDYLCVTGDMGCYVFSRIEDMFEFFRGDGISPNYWAEKLQSDCKRDGWREFNPEAFEESIRQDFEKWDFASEEEKEDVWSEIEMDVLSQDGHDIYHGVQTFDSSYGDYRFNPDFFVDGGSGWYRPTLSYLLCLWAIIHGIKMYDEHKERCPDVAMVDLNEIDKAFKEHLSNNFDPMCSNRETFYRDGDNMACGGCYGDFYKIPSINDEEKSK
jgi:hypothetical protein